MITRRRFALALAVAAFAAPRASLAQQRPGIPTVIGFLPLGSPSNEHDQSLVASFRQELREVGLVENRDVTLDIVWVGNESGYARALRS
jgi:hypothetical protein